jgi:CRISPR-associated endonuclease/helicase Cas3
LSLLDEAHLSEPFRQTLEWLERYKSDDWREDRSIAAPWDLALLTATPGKRAVNTFQSEEG